MKEQTKEKILKQTVISINQKSLKKHHDFLPSIYKTMDIYAQEQIKKKCEECKIKQSL